MYGLGDKMAYTIGDNLTWEQYSEILKIAADKFLEVKTEIMPSGKWVTIAGLPVGCGYGVLQVKTPKSHRKSDKMRNIGAKWLYGNATYTAFYWEISNTEEMITKVKAVGATIVREYAPVARVIIPNEESIKQVAKE